MTRKHGVSPNLLRALLGLYVLASLSYWVGNAVIGWESTFHFDRHVREPFKIDPETATVSDPQAETKAAGIETGARVV